MICPECNHDMYDESDCIECGFYGVGYCQKAWSRMCNMYDDKESLEKVLDEIKNEMG